MKNKMLKGFVCMAVIAAFVSCQKKEETVVVAAPDKAQIKTEIQSMESAFADKMNSNASDSIVYYADDATSYSQNKPALVGKASIYKNMKEEVDTAPKGSKIAYEALEVFPSNDGNQVVEIGSYKVTDSTNASLFSGHYMALFEKRDGKYTCIRDMSASEIPMAKK